MANYKEPWNKGKGMSLEERKRRKAEYYYKNKEKCLQRIKERYAIPEVRKKRLEYSRWQLIKYKYGLTKEQWMAMYEKQNSCCGLCDKPKTIQQLRVDHDHATGLVRKLVCAYCNIVMGVIDNEILLKQALRYKSEFK